MEKRFFSRKIVLVGAVIACSAVLIFLNPRGLVTPLRVVIISAAYPFQRTFSGGAVAVSSWLDFIRSIGTLKSENEFLQRENIRLMADNATLRDMRTENEILRKQLELAPREDYQLEAAIVVGQDPEQAGSWILINKGERHGLRKGMPVVVSDRLLVGRVEEVLPFVSRVALVTSPESAIGGVVSATDTKGIVQGEHGLGLVFGMVLQTDSLQNGDQVITSGIGGDMPRGLTIGVVHDARLTPDRLYQQASLVSPVHFSSLRFVFVVKQF